MIFIQFYEDFMQVFWPEKCCHLTQRSKKKKQVKEGEVQEKKRKQKRAERKKKENQPILFLLTIEN